MIRTALALFVAVLILPAVPDVDLWGHTLFGGDILAVRAVPTSDPYSFTSDVPWINHEWASELAMYSSFALSGGAGLVALRALLLALTFWLVARELRRQGASAEALFALIAFLALITYPRTQHVRPQLFSLVSFAALLTALLRYDRTRSLHSLLPVPFVMIAWANSHGGFVLGMLPRAAWGCALLSDRATSIKHKAAGAAILTLAVAATLINPYGVGLWRFLGSTVGLGRPDIPEWWSVLDAGAGVLAFWLVTIAVAGVALSRSPRPIPWHRVALIAGLAVGSFRVSRLDAFFASQPSCASPGRLAHYGAPARPDFPANAVSPRQRRRQCSC